MVISWFLTLCRIEINFENNLMDKIDFYYVFLKLTAIVVLLIIFIQYLNNIVVWIFYRLGYN